MDIQVPNFFSNSNHFRSVVFGRGSMADLRENQPRPRGRPQSDSVAMTLRLPRHLMRSIVSLAAQRSKGSERVVSAQAVVLEALERFIRLDEEGHGAANIAYDKASDEEAS